MPVEAFALACNRPAPVVDAASYLIKANNIRAQLGKRHSARRRGNKRTPFDDAKSFE